MALEKSNAVMHAMDFGKQSGMVSRSASPAPTRFAFSILYTRATIGLLLTSVAPLSRARVSLPWQAAMPRDSPSTVLCNVVGVECVGPMRVSSGWGDEAANVHVSAEGVGKWARDALRQVFVRGEGFDSPPM